MPQSSISDQAKFIEKKYMEEFGGSGSGSGKHNHNKDFNKKNIFSGNLMHYKHSLGKEDKRATTVDIG